MALYSKEGKDLEIQPGQIVLHIKSEDRALYSEYPKVITASLQTAQKSTRTITFYSSVGVVYETGRRGYVRASNPVAAVTA